MSDETNFKQETKNEHVKKQMEKLIKYTNMDAEYTKDVDKYEIKSWIIK